MKLKALETPPPGVRLKTVTLAVPVTAMSVAEIDAVSRVSLAKVVVRALPFHRTTASLTKFVPVTCRVKATTQTVAEFGLMLVTVGTGLTI